MNRKKFLCAMVLALVLCAAPHGEASAKAKKPSMPPYRPNGAISGTDLTYERLTINEEGVMNILIVNPKPHGVSFTSNFSFYGNSGGYVTGFTLSGFVPASGKVGYSLELEEYKKLQKASSMRVLGRAGRMGKTDEDGETGEE
jgi:hypothetical protein